MITLNKFYEDLPRKGQKVNTSKLVNLSLIPITENFNDNRRTSKGIFVCFAIFQTDSDESEVWFVKHEDESIAAYHPFEVTIDGR